MTSDTENIIMHYSNKNTFKEVLEEEIDVDLENLDFETNNSFNILDEQKYTNNHDNYDEQKLSEEYIKNPFYLQNGESALSNIEEKDLYSNYKKVYILCTKNDYKNDYNNVSLSSVDQETILKFFEKNITLDDIKSFGKYFIITQSSSKMLKNKEHYSNAFLIDTNPDSNILEYFNHNKYVFENMNEIVIPMIELTEHFVNIYKEQYKTKENDTSLIQSLMLDIYYNRDGYNPNYSSISKKITEIKESDFWCQSHNCNFTINTHFLNRKFDYNGATEPYVKAFVRAYSLENLQNTDVKKVINKLDKEGVKDINYLDHIYRKEIYVDAMDALKDNKKRTYFATPNEKIEESMFNTKSVTEIFNSLDIKLHKKQLYDIFNTLLVSKEYCHLVLNNKLILEKMKPIIDQYYHLYRYLFGYAWMCFYTEECIFKTKTTETNRYVFDIETANKLPIFPVIPKDLHLNPYLTILVSKKALNSDNNCLALSMNFANFENYYGVCNLEQFKTRFNLFTSGREHKSIFDGINWDNFAVSGSLISACLQKKSQLFDLVSQPEQSESDNLKTFYSHYYSESDIDLMCKKESVFDFMDEIQDVIKIVNKNIFNTNNTNNNDINEIKLTIEPKKSMSLVIHLDFLSEKLNEINKKINKNYTATEIKDNISTLEIKEYLYELYTINKNKQNIQYKKKYTNQNILYEHFYKETNIEDMNIYIVDNIIKYDNNYTNNEPKDSETYFYVNDYRSHDTLVSKENNKILFKICENIKFKLHSNKLLHSIEAFRIKGQSFFNTVARFHLPCVRGFYNGKNVYMLPSCVTAMMTGINIDYKYFAGIRDPIDILNKYRMRGYGILLNDHEKQHMVYYNSKLNSKLNNMFNINIKNKENINKFFGPQHINENIYKPLVFLKNFPKDIYNTISLSLKVFTKISDISDYLDDEKNYDSTNSLINTLKLKSINNDGKVEPLKKWIMEACY